MKTNSAAVGIGAVPIDQAAQYDRIHELSTRLSPSDRRMDWPEALALAIDAYDRRFDVGPGIGLDAKGLLRGANPALWANLSNRGAAIKAFGLLLDDGIEAAVGPV